MNQLIDFPFPKSLQKSLHYLDTMDKLYMIKFARPTTGAQNKTPIWDFDIRANEWRNGRNYRVIPQTPRCDYYILIGLLNDQPHKFFVIPAYAAPRSHIRISVTGQSKYHQYAV